MNEWLNEWMNEWMNDERNKKTHLEHLYVSCEGVQILHTHLQLLVSPFELNDAFTEVFTFNHRGNLEVD